LAAFIAQKNYLNMQDQDSVNKVDRNKVYFLIIVIAALLGINAYLYFKDKQQSSRFVTVSTEKDRLKLEVEKIEVELDKVNSLNVNLSDKLQQEQKLARDKIAELKLALQKGKLTQGDLEEAQKQISALREFVKNYNDQITHLEKENLFLKSERDSLKSTTVAISQKADELAKQNENLNAKVKVGEALKTSSLSIAAYKVKSSGKVIEVTKASTANKLVVNFTIASNELAEKGYKKIYLRVFDPAGNLIANGSDMFEANGQQMQYSNKIQVSFNSDDTVYNIDWTNPKEFIKGAYVVILYADGFEMGKGKIILK
jgi:predicted  nucleic acid-binding Zn-ribbon protein